MKIVFKRSPVDLMPEGCHYRDTNDWNRPGLQRVESLISIIDISTASYRGKKQLRTGFLHLPLSDVLRKRKKTWRTTKCGAVRLSALQSRTYDAGLDDRHSMIKYHHAMIFLLHKNLLYDRYNKIPATCLLFSRTFLLEYVNSEANLSLPLAF